MGAFRGCTGGGLERLAPPEEGAAERPPELLFPIFVECTDKRKRLKDRRKEKGEKPENTVC